MSDIKTETQKIWLKQKYEEVRFLSDDRPLFYSAIIKSLEELTRLQAENERLNDEIQEIMSSPPCRECGAMTEKEAEIKCMCGGDKDDCQGNYIWKD